MNIIDIIEKNVVPYIRQPVWENWYIKERIGSGSFSVVYRIEANRINSTDISAMKIEVITTDGQIFTDMTVKGQFLEARRNVFDNEVRIMKQLRDCPYIVRYEDEHIQELFIDGNFEGYYCMIRMEYLSSVYNLMKNGRFDYSEQNVKKLALNIGQELKSAHDINVIHRDIKPDNLFVSEKGIYKLGDFNISKRADNTRSFAGSQLYMSPEVYRSKTNVDNSYTKQADIYSLGLCLYQMMNDGMLPFEENCYSEDAFEKRMSGMQIQPPKNASAQFSYIILKACAFNPLNRYNSIDEMLYDLEQISQISTQQNYPSANNNSTQYAGNKNDFSSATTNTSLHTQYVGNNQTGVQHSGNIITNPPYPPYPPTPPTPPYPPNPPIEHNSNTKLLILIIIIWIILITAGISAFMFFKNKNQEENNSDENSVYSSEMPTEQNKVESIENSDFTSSEQTETEVTTELTTETTTKIHQEVLTEIQPVEKVTEPEKVNYPPSFPYVSATSELSPIKNNDGTFYYSASNVFDGSYSTCWAEGSSGDGINESIFMTADEKQRVSEIIITNGLYTNAELFYKNNRVKDCLIEFSDGTSQTVTLLGDYSEQSNRIVFNPPVDTEYIKITILSVYSGNKYNDTCISEISVN